MKKNSKKNSKRDSRGTNSERLSNNKISWKEFEKVTSEIFAQLSPQSKVTLDKRIKGRAGIERQIDVAIEAKISGIDILVIVQCKSSKRKVSVVEVGEFSSVIDDISASKGVLVANSGFSKGAVALAKSKRINLSQIHDAKTRDWRLDLKIPIELVVVRPSLQLFFQTRKHVVPDFKFIKLAGVPIIDGFYKEWKLGQLNLALGNHLYDLKDRKVEYVTETGQQEEIRNLQLTYANEEKRFLKYVSDLKDVKGLKSISDDNTTVLVNCNEIQDIIEAELNCIEQNVRSPVPRVYGIRVPGKINEIHLRPKQKL